MSCNWFESEFKNSLNLTITILPIMVSSSSDFPSTDQLLSVLTKAKLYQTISSESVNTDEMLKNLEQVKKEPEGRLVMRKQVLFDQLPLAGTT